MWKRIYFVFLVVLTATNLVALGFWLERKYAPPRGPEPPPRRMLAPDSHLNPERLAAYQALQHSFKHTADSLGREVMTLRRALMDEILAASPDTTRINQLLVRLNRAELESERRLFDHLLEIKQYMTPAQQRRLFRYMLSRVGERPAPQRRRQEINLNPKGGIP